jgi:hypothetical protein
MVAYVCNPSCLGSGDQNSGSRPAWAKIIKTHLHKSVVVPCNPSYVGGIVRKILV